MWTRTSLLHQYWGKTVILPDPFFFLHNERRPSPLEFLPLLAMLFNGRSFSTADTPPFPPPHEARYDLVQLPSSFYISLPSSDERFFDN